MQRFQCKFQVKAVSESGEFEGYAAVFDNVDLGGDVIEHGAFKRTIEVNDGKVPILDSHQVHVEIGLTSFLSEDAHGLKFKGQLYIDGDTKMDLPPARAAYIRMKNRAAKDRPMGMSFGYDVIQHEFQGRVRRLKELKLWEVSPVTFPMNPDAGVTRVKGATAQDFLTLGRAFLNEKDVALTAQERGALAALLTELQALAARPSGPASGHPDGRGTHIEGSTDDPDMAPLVSALRDIQDFCKNRRDVR